MDWTNRIRLAMVTTLESPWFLLPAVFLAFALMSACGKPNKAQKEQLDAAIEVIKGSDPSLGTGLEGVRKGDRLQVNSLPAQVGGLTHGDKSTTMAGDTIQVNKNRFSDDPDYRCTLSFLLLSLVLIHEGQHAVDIEAPGKTLLERKLERARIEKKAYEKELHLMDEWLNAIKTALVGVTPPPPFAFLAECARKNREELETVELYAGFRRADLVKIRDFLEDVITHPDQNGDGKQDEADAEKMDRRKIGSVTGSDVLGGVKTVAHLDSGSPMITVFSPRTGRVHFLTTPFRHPTACMFIPALDAWLVGGTDSLDAPQCGTVALYTDVNRDGSYDHMAVLRDLTGLRMPRNFTAREGSVFVFDSGLRALWELIDTNCDGVLDTVSRTPALQVPVSAEADAGFPLDPINQVHLIDGEFLGFHDIATGDIDSGSPVAHWASRNVALEYEGYKIWPLWGVTRPYPIEPMFAGSKTIAMRGAPGSTIEVVRLSRRGEQAPVGTGVIGTDGVGSVSVRPIQGNGFSYLFNDVNKGYQSDPIASDSPHPFVAQISPQRVEGLDGGDLVTLAGRFLGDVVRVRVGDVDTPVLNANSKLLVFAAPRQATPGQQEIVLTDDEQRTFFAGDLFYHVQSFPRIVIERPTFQDLLQASRGMASQLTIEVLVADDMIGAPEPCVPVSVVNQADVVVGSGSTNAEGRIQFVVTIDPTSRDVAFTVRATLNGTRGPTLQESLPVR